MNKVQSLSEKFCIADQPQNAKKNNTKIQWPTACFKVVCITNDQKKHHTLKDIENQTKKTIKLIQHFNTRDSGFFPKNKLLIYNVWRARV